jgi:hypothetical protein
MDAEVLSVLSKILNHHQNIEDLYEADMDPTLKFLKMGEENEEIGKLVMEILPG